MSTERTAPGFAAGTMDVIGESVSLQIALAGLGTVRADGEFEGVGVVRVDLGGAEVLVGDDRTNCRRDSATFEALGIEPTERQVVALKSGYLSPEWKEIAARRLFALTAGDTNQSLRDLPYDRTPRPIYPLDEETRWSA